VSVGLASPTSTSCQPRRVSASKWSLAAAKGLDSAGLAGVGQGQAPVASRSGAAHGGSVLTIVEDNNIKVPSSVGCLSKMVARLLDILYVSTRSSNSDIPHEAKIKNGNISQGETNTL